MSDDVWALILAAGQSSRMGQPKMLLPSTEGITILRQSIRRALEAGNCRVAVVAARQGPVSRDHAGDAPVDWIDSDCSELGLGASLASGLRELVKRHSPRGVIVLLGDQPDVQSRLIRRVADTYRETQAPIVQVRYADRPAHPVLFDAGMYPELMELSGDFGAREVLRRHRSRIVYVDSDDLAPRDLDTPEDYRDYLRSAEPES
ncbi:nucleotidyltransferase family protein [Cohnella thermotolerans]|uniref:nucleotidyltransferase family protein n=1 Tax=Cohnella thermotolerans TaxID=329858 RepID=UPI0003FF3143|nr:nucleotidyltransferase family protein [Cohnella thermotolerans]